MFAPDKHLRIGRGNGWLVVTVTFISRFALGLVLVGSHGPGLFFEGNESANIAAHLISGHGFAGPYQGAPAWPTAQQPPVYPVILALIFHWFGPYTRMALLLAILLNSLAAAITAWLIRAAGQRHFTRMVGVLASWMWAMWPYTAMSGLPLGNYALCAALVAGAFVSLPALRDANTLGPYVLFGLAAAASALVNPILIVVAATTGLGIWWHNRFSAAATWRLSVAATVGLIGLLPWMIRNYVAFHEVIPVRDNFGLELWIGNRPGMTGTADLSGDFPPADPREYSRLGEIEFMRSKQREALRFIRSNPSAFAWRFCQRYIQFWSGPTWCWLVLSLLGWLGIAFAVRRNPFVGSILFVTCGVIPLIYSTTHFLVIYRHPIEPLILIAASYAVVTVWASCRSWVGVDGFPRGVSLLRQRGQE